MAKREISMSDKKRTLKGLKDGGIVTLSCTSCQRELLCLQLTSIENEPAASVLTRIAAKCGFCGGHSEVEQVAGQFYPGAPSDDLVIDIASDDGMTIETDVLFKASPK
jgi:hypothetical protein